MRKPAPATPGGGGEVLTTARWRLAGLADVSIWTAYVVLGTLLCWTRLVGLDRSLWLDEVITVEDYVRRGPGAILAGAYLPNNHELFSLLAWLTTSAAGESEVALRLWSVLPFLAGVALVTGWLHVCVDRLSGVLFLALATCSPLLLDITPAARGYGLAFLSMGAVVVCALEADRSGKSAWLLVFVAAGIAGMWTFPHFAAAFYGIAAVLLANTALRRRMALGLVVSAAAAVGWYAPHAAKLFVNPGQEYGNEIGLAQLVTSPLDDVFVPALLWYDGVVPADRLVLFPLTLLWLVVMASSPLVGRSRRTAIVLAGPVLTTFALWYLELKIVPRFSSYLLVPLFMLAATGAASILQGRTRWARVKAPLAIAALGLVALMSAYAVYDVARLPREANENAATWIRENASPDARVYHAMVEPRSVAFYLGRPLEPAPAQAVLCSAREPVVLVHQRFMLQPPSVSCLDRPGVRQYRAEQYGRGREIVVWIVPPR
jgi:hypothetical protein